jgi:hypothetical protein
MITTIRLPALTDAEKRALCKRLERWGLLRRVRGQWHCTRKGHLVAAAIFTIATEKAERDQNQRLQ